MVGHTILTEQMTDGLHVVNRTITVEDDRTVDIQEIIAMPPLTGWTESEVR